ncbi:MAG: metal-dependent hydrolase [Candidatus Magnetomorum sp.]|nr:metal-dependent hydrolase [Candidatus Magnetomorum sp.]
MDNSLKWRNYFFVAYAFIGLHLFLDVITSYGTQIFLPFSNVRYSIPCVFIIDFLLTGVLVAGVIWACFHIKYRQLIASITLGFILIYPGFCKTIQYIQLERSKTVFSQGTESFTSITVLPAFFAPLYWKIIIEKENSYELRHLSILADVMLSQAYIYTKADLKQMIRWVPQVRFIKTFDWFVDFPAERRQKIDQMHCISIFDLKFISAHPWIERLRDVERMPFQLHLFFNDHHQFVNYRF